MNPWLALPETSAAQRLEHCNECGACCRVNPCLLAPADVARLEERLGPVANFTQVERTPAGRWLVRMRRPCAFLVENRCSINDIKPTGGRDFECWSPDRRNYFWNAVQLERIGFDVNAVLAR